MPRLPRIHIEEGLYFITATGDHGEKLFKDDADREQYLEFLARYKEQYRFKLFSYALMVTYVHLLIELGKETTISDIMRDINTNYTKYFNGRHQRGGHLFAERFKARLVQKESYLLELTRYIHLVPKMAHAVDRPGNYKWSSYQYYLNPHPGGVQGVGVNVKEVLARFSSQPQEQASLYRQFMEQADEDRLGRWGKRLQRSGMLGSKEFAEEIKERLKEDALKERKEKQLAGVSSRAHRAFIVAGSAAALILVIFVVYFYRANLGLKERFDNIAQKKEAEFSQQLSREQQRLKRSLEEKHRADKVSYQAMSKRLEIEKQKSQELNKKLEEGERK